MTGSAGRLGTLSTVPRRMPKRSLRELLTTNDMGEYVAPTKETVGGFLQRWLDTYAATNTSMRTQEGYRERAFRYLLPNLGTVPLTRLDPEQVQSLYTRLLASGLSARTVLGVHRLLKQALTHAVKWRLLTRNVCDAVDPPRPEPKENGFPE